MKYLHCTDLLPPQPWKGYVHSVFRHSCNLMGPDGLLVTLHSLPGRVLPRSYYIPDLDTGFFQQGMPVAVTSRALLFQGFTISGDPKHNKLSTKIKPGGCCGTGSLQPAKGLLREARRKQCRELPPLAELLPTLLEIGRELVAAALGGTREKLTQAVERCVGFGYGLTPSGDDLLLGVLTLLESRGMEAPELKEAVWEQRWRTNDISRTYLEMALRGHAASFVQSAAAGLRDKADQSAILRLLEMGHTSGADVLEGMLLACEYLQQSPTAV